MKGSYESSSISNQGETFMQIKAELTPPALISKFNFMTNEYQTEGVGPFEKNGTHLITWLIGQKEITEEFRGVE